MVISDLILELHKLATETKETDLSIKIRLLADELAKIGNELFTRENEDKLCSLEFEYTTVGCEKAVQYLKDTGNYHLIEKELSVDGYSIVALANDIKTKGEYMDTNSDKLCSLTQADAFAKKRNYTYSYEPL